MLELAAQAPRRPSAAPPKRRAAQAPRRPSAAPPKRRAASAKRCAKPRRCYLGVGTW
jgi:hypothetical protein